MELTQEQINLIFETGRNFQLTGENNLQELLDSFEKDNNKSVNRMLVRLTKQKVMQDHPNINDDFEMVGELLKFEEGQSLVVVNEQLHFVSSTVIKKEEFTGYKLAYTNNYVYRIENAMPAIGGVQEKYNVKI